MTGTRAARIAVIGAGPGGLTLACVLQRHGLSATVYERDRHPADRPQGGTLDLHAGSGQTALEAAGLLERFHAVARPEGQDTRLLGHDGAVLFEEHTPDGETFHPEIDRGDLRALLLDPLAADTVVWDRQLVDVVADGGSVAEGGAYRLTFADGRTATYDLVVGADGAWSKVRPLLSADTPVYSGVTFVEFIITDVDTAHPEIAALVGRGGMSAPWRSRSLMAQRNSRGVVRGYAAVRGSEGPLDDVPPAALRATLLDMFADWAPELRRLLVVCADEFIVRPIMALPVPHRWAPRSGVTLLGDAAHLMSPFGGQGANLAMLDGAELALALVDEPDVDAAVRRYEDAMFPRSARSAGFSARGIERAIADDAPAHSLAMMQAMAAGKNPFTQNG